MPNRRDVLKWGLRSGVALSLAALRGVSFASTAAGDARLVVVILRGALDGLSAVPPYGDADYARVAEDVREELRQLGRAEDSCRARITYEGLIVSI